MFVSATSLRLWPDRFVKRFVLNSSVVCEICAIFS